MIWNDDFVWLHFPKCAGTKIESLFHRYYRHRKDIRQDVVNSAIDPKATWHDTLSERENRDESFVTGKRRVICSIRRLPAWLESRYNFEAARSRELKHDPEKLLTGRFLNRNGSEGHADNAARRYLPADLLASPQLVFIRTEFFEADFRRAFAPFINVNRIPVDEFSIRVNTSKNRVPPEILEQLHHENKAVYAHCPYWTEVEKRAYGEV